MEKLNLNWQGPFEMTIETPDWAEGKKGLFVITHDVGLFYLGKAQEGRNAVFKEAKNRENKWINCLKRIGKLPSSIADAAARKYVHKHCRIYVALLDGEQLRWIGKTEEYLIFKLQKQLPCNSLVENKHELERGFSIINSGNLPPGLPQIL